MKNSGLFAIVAFTAAVTGILPAAASTPVTNDVPPALVRLMENRNMLDSIDARAALATEAGITDAINLCRRGLAVEPDNTDLLYRLFNLYCKAERMDEAIPVYEKYLSLEPDDESNIYNHAVTLFQLGCDDEARKAFEAILKNTGLSDITHEGARRMLARLDAKYQALSRYTFEFKWLPIMADKIKAVDGWRSFGVARLLNTGLTRLNEYKSPFSDSDIKISRHKVNGTDFFVWRLPEPTQCPECRFVAFVPRADGVGFRVLTLEKSIMEPWVLGEATTSGHLSFKFLSDDVPTAADFVSLIEKSGVLGDAKPASSFTAPKK